MPGWRMQCTGRVKWVRFKELLFSFYREIKSNLGLLCSTAGKRANNALTLTRHAP